MIYGPDNYYWVAGFTTDQIIRISPTNGSMKTYGLPTSPSHPFGMVSVGTNIWFTENYANKIGLFYTNANTGKGDHTFQEFPIHSVNNAGIPCGPAGLTVGPDPNLLWFVESQTNKIGSFNLTTHAIVEYKVPFVQNYRQYYNIVAGPDGNLWYTDSGAGRICAFSPASSGSNGTVAVFPLATNSEPFDIIVGPDNAIWFTEFNSCKIGRLTTDCFNPASFTSDLTVSTNINTNALTETTVPTSSNNTVALTNAEPYGLTVVTNGTNINVWFTEYAGSAIDRIDIITTTNGTSNHLARFPIPAFDARPTRLASGADTNLWFGEYANNAAGKLVLDHSLILTAGTISWIGTTFNGVLATFTDDPTNSPATNYSAVVSWGDGSTNNFAPPTNSLLNLVTNAGGGFKVNGSHHFPAFGSYSATLTITNNGTNLDTGGANGTATFLIVTMPVPSIAIKPAGTGKVALSWTNAATNVVLQLQVNTNLTSTNWVHVTNAPALGAGNQFTVTNNTSGRAFYRLKAP